MLSAKILSISYDGSPQHLLQTENAPPDDEILQGISLPQRNKKNAHTHHQKKVGPANMTMTNIIYPVLVITNYPHK